MKKLIMQGMLMLAIAVMGELSSQVHTMTHLGG